MISPAEIKIKAERKYPGYLQAILEGSPFFPLQITGDKNPGKTVAEFQSQLIPLLNQSKQKKASDILLIINSSRLKPLAPNRCQQVYFSIRKMII